MAPWAFLATWNFDMVFRRCWSGLHLLPSLLRLSRQGLTADTNAPMHTNARALCFACRS